MLRYQHRLQQQASKTHKRYAAEKISYRLIIVSLSERFSVFEPLNRRLRFTRRSARQAEIAVGIQHNVIDSWIAFHPSWATYRSDVIT